MQLSGGVCTLKSERFIPALKKSKKWNFIESRYEEGKYFCTLTYYKLNIIRNESLLKRLILDKAPPKT